jgi:hypothetical protein
LFFSLGPTSLNLITSSYFFSRATEKKEKPTSEKPTMAVRVLFETVFDRQRSFNDHRACLGAERASVRALEGAAAGRGASDHDGAT